MYLSTVFDKISTCAYSLLRATCNAIFISTLVGNTAYLLQIDITKIRSMYDIKTSMFYMSIFAFLWWVFLLSYTVECVANSRPTTHFICRIVTTARHSFSHSVVLAGALTPLPLIASLHNSSASRSALFAMFV